MVFVQITWFFKTWLEKPIEFLVNMQINLEFVYWFLTLWDLLKQRNSLRRATSTLKCHGHFAASSPNTLKTNTWQSCKQIGPLITHQVAEIEIPHLTKLTSAGDFHFQLFTNFKQKTKAVKSGAFCRLLSLCPISFRRWTFLAQRGREGWEKTPHRWSSLLIQCPFTKIPVSSIYLLIRQSK